MPGEQQLRPRVLQVEGDLAPFKQHVHRHDDAARAQDPVVGEEELRHVRQHHPDPVAGLRLDRSSPVPLHRQVAQWLEAGIASGRLPPGTRLDNEVALADSLGLSRPTLRQAMRYLVEKGLIVRRRGAGTRVGQPLDLPAPVPDSSYDELRAGRRMKILVDL